MRSGLHGASRAFHMLHDMLEIGFKNQFDGAGDVRCTEQRSAQNFQCMRRIVWYLVQLFFFSWCASKLLLCRATITDIHVIAVLSLTSIGPRPAAGPLLIMERDALPLL